ncbi:uncharacterized protein EI90DRAFT_3080552 [Cantharellus anzutake]|uniref:uncharacterized protein n=1 Tax=Cantharellus anzutake TaxID=1750568 RepID=UPI00190704E2|nr:uncharacterized protein EI90DRAFT_3080552 [Cantharellus anzutake]KAF8320549.1 hypothetical protein EI90DRAFT_3080552 [Cantharellus anzutake]
MFSFLRKPLSFISCRSKSTSPYGRSHLKRAPALPQPVVAQFQQTVVLTDGSTYTRWSTSPRSVIRLTRDVNNNPLWSPGQEGREELEDETGRMGRFRRQKP